MSMLLHAIAVIIYFILFVISNNANQSTVNFILLIINVFGLPAAILNCILCISICYIYVKKCNQIRYDLSQITNKNDKNNIITKNAQITLLNTIIIFVIMTIILVIAQIFGYFFSFLFASLHMLQYAAYNSLILWALVNIVICVFLAPFSRRLYNACCFIPHKKCFHTVNRRLQM